MANNSQPDPSIDPYAAPSVGPSSQQQMRLGLDFWLPIVFSLAVSLAAIVALFMPGSESPYYIVTLLFGFFGSLTTVMAIARGFVWQSRLPGLDRTQLETNGFVLYVTSMALGFSASLISILCCAVVCVPTSIMLLSTQPSVDGATSIIFLSIVCICLGLFVGTLFVRWTVPKVPMK
jgi:hypothetical protein